MLDVLVAAIFTVLAVGKAPRVQKELRRPGILGTEPLEPFHRPRDFRLQAGDAVVA